MKQKVEEFRNNTPLLHALFHPGMTDRHWNDVFQIVGKEFETETLTLNKAIEMNLERFIAQFEPIAEFAAKEYSLKLLLAKMEEEWTDVGLFLLFGIGRASASHPC